MNEKSLIIDNINISYYENSDKNKGKTLLFLHGWGQSGMCFENIIETYLDDYRCIAIDFPGFGNSDEPKEAWDVQNYANFLNSFVQAINLTNFNIIGHSFGCRVTFKYINHYQNSVQKIFLTGAAGVKPKRDYKYKLSVKSYQFKKMLVKTPFYFQFKDDLYNSSGSEDYKNASPLMKGTLSKVVNEDLSYTFSNIKIPTFLFWGEFDDATPLSDGQLMHQNIQDSSLKIVKGSHFAFLEFPSEFATEIKKFIS